ncbi:hypothetical protein GCM10010353_46470 [Streptomyces chryseus]|nr:hypothetical protein GCM10010353_46470 [Streptomyces chryseus]
MRRYPPIADHGLIGDLQTCALVSSDGVVDWFRTPRFDSPSIFASLLDHDRGGHFSITVDVPGTTVRQLYLADTAVLITRFMTPDGVGEVVDFMPVDQPERATDRHRLVRAMRVVRGTVRFGVECRPRFDYGRAPHRLTLDDGAARFHGPGVDVHLQTAGPLSLRRDGDDVRAEVVLRKGELAATALTVCAAGGEAPRPFTAGGARAEFTAVWEFWHRWIGRSRYRGRWQGAVNRSAVTLKLLTYAPTGAPVAAATVGLPEQIGGERNWDYRYTWIRDASLSVGAFVRPGLHRGGGRLPLRGPGPGRGERGHAAANPARRTRRAAPGRRAVVPDGCLYRLDGWRAQRTSKRRTPPSGPTGARCTRSRCSCAA